jgi:hypothetical protein
LQVAIALAAHESPPVNLSGGHMGTQADKFHDGG